MATPNTLKRLRDRKERLQTRLKKLEVEQQLRDARAGVRARKAETRRLILLGRWLEMQIDRNPKVATWVRRGLDKWLDRPHDRALFGFDDGHPAAHRS